MPKLIIEGWHEGMQKVSLTELQVEILGMPLKESKSNVDSLLEGKEIVLEIKDNDIAKKFCQETEKIGVKCRVLDNVIFHEYDVIKAKQTLGNVQKGARGTILIVHDYNHFVVEFMTETGETIAVTTVLDADIELVIPYKR